MTLDAIKSISPDTHLVRDHGPFQLRRIHPGVALGRTDDGGFGGLGLIDHARLQPGLVVRMHEHRNDEIISYLRSGRMQHTDSAGRSEVISPDRLMVMNAGASFFHEEAVLGDDPIEMLQIFVRPEAADMDASRPVRRSRQNRKHRSLAASGGAMRLGGAELRPPGHLPLRCQPLGGCKHRPAGDAGVRSLAVCFPRRGLGRERTSRNAYGVGDQRRHTALDVTASREADLVLFLVDRQAPFSRAGTLSG